MPLELPGFYFDVAKNRYFPISSKQKNPPQTVPQVHSSPNSLTNSKPHKRPRISSWRQNETVRTNGSVSKRYRIAHDSQCSRYARHAHVLEEKVPVFGRIKSFATAMLDGIPHRFIGDSRGWLYTSNNTQEMWQADLNLQPESEVSSICISGLRCIATTFGPSANIAVQDFNVVGHMVGRTSLLSLNGVHDIWSSHLQDAALVLGVSKKAVYMNDIDTSRSLQELETQSDVFAVWQHENTIFAGCRNASIMRFDKRLGKRGQKLYNNRFQSKQRTSVLHLQVLADWQLLTSHMNGELMIYDLRFAREGTPLVQFEGHRNTYTQRLGIALDPSRDFLFAAGEDRRIRGWSVRTGRPLEPPTSPSDDDINTGHPLATVYRGIVETMQVTEENDGLCLWAGVDQNLYRIYLGQQ